MGNLSAGFFSLFVCVLYKKVEFEFLFYEIILKMNKIVLFFPWHIKINLTKKILSNENSNFFNLIVFLKNRSDGHGWTLSRCS